MADKKHSEFGIASFVLGIIAVVLIFIFFAIANFVNISEFDSVTAEHIPTEVIVVGVIYLLLIVDIFIALTFGVIGLFGKDRKIVFSVAGLIFSIFISIFLIAVTIISLSVQ